METQEFLELCKTLIVKYFNEEVDKSDDFKLTIDDVFVVWSCKTLQNNKALLATRFTDNMYYECTYNGDRKEMYIDAYEKHNNYTVTLPKYIDK